MFKYLWMLPQNLLGLILLLLFKGKFVSVYNECNVYKVNKKGFSGGSFGKYILLDEVYFKQDYEHYLYKTIKHEYGHYLQGNYFGPLYLIIIGIPSLTNNIRARFDVKVAETYYDRYPESWADKLGNVKR